MLSYMTTPGIGSSPLAVAALALMQAPPSERSMVWAQTDAVCWVECQSRGAARARAFYEEGFGRLPATFFTQLNEEPGYNTSLFRVTDPVNRRTLMGIARTNLMARTIDWFMLGPPGPLARACGRW